MRTPPRPVPATRIAVATPSRDVVGVDEQRRVDAERLDLRAERVLFGVVQERPGVRGRAHRGDAPRPSRLEVRGGAEPGDVGGARGGDGRLLAGTARAHLGQRPVARGDAHAGGGGRDGGVVVEHAQRERLEHDGLGERALDREDRRSGKVQLALAVAGDRAGEAVALEEVEGRGIHHPLVAQEAQLVVAEAEVADEAQQPPGARHDAEAAARRRGAGRTARTRTGGRRCRPGAPASSIVSS